MFRYLTGKFIQVVGAVAKLVFFVVHLVAPALRFEIPKSTPPLLRRASTSPIPRVLWQTNYSRRVSLSVYVNYLFNRVMAPTFEFRMSDDEDAAEFVRTSCLSEDWQNYQRLQIGAARADFWRLLVIYRHGGAYLDVDATLIWPLGSTLGSHHEVFVRHGRKFTNFCFASVAQTDAIAAMIAAVIRNIEEGTIKSVSRLTGPMVFVKVLANHPPSRVVSYSHACRETVFTNEFFQYLDRPAGKWHREEKTVSIIKEK